MDDEFDPDAPLAGGYYDSDEVPAGLVLPMKPWIKHGRCGRPSTITAEIVAEILSHIRAGTFAWIAAEASGISTHTFYKWIKLGRMPLEQYKTSVITDADKIAHSLMTDLANGVEQAKAQARALAEQALFLSKPGVWLRLGPGRDMGDPEKPGWTNPAIRREGAKHSHAHLHLNANPPPLDLTRLTSAELQALERLTAKALPAKPEVIELSDG